MRPKWSLIPLVNDYNSIFKDMNSHMTWGYYIGYGVILGLDWLGTLSLMHIDWYSKWIEFKQADKTIKLQVTHETVMLKFYEVVKVDKALKSS
jgi:hypothetical protein